MQKIVWESAAPTLKAFLCLFDVQFRTLITFEGIEIFLFLEKGIEALFLVLIFLLKL